MGGRSCGKTVLRKFTAQSFQNRHNIIAWNVGVLVFPYLDILAENKLGKGWPFQHIVTFNTDPLRGFVTPGSECYFEYDHVLKR